MMGHVAISCHWMGRDRHVHDTTEETSPIVLCGMARAADLRTDGTPSDGGTMSTRATTHHARFGYDLPTDDGQWNCLLPHASDSTQCVMSTFDIIKLRTITFV
jgi:hypothetical protein